MSGVIGQQVGRHKNTSRRRYIGDGGRSIINWSLVIAAVFIILLVVSGQPL